MSNKYRDYEMKGDFEITISDGFCAWKFALTPTIDHVCISDLINTLRREFKSEKLDEECLGLESELKDYLHKFSK